ncbi:MAG: hypothetical protein LBR60_01090 [Fibrobacter sp.]|jgi:hypothetical protein|nr:hypothetical protein [Fibrobacter sp.]
MNKNSLQTVLLLAIAGAALLVAGMLFFDSPLFGWVISILIFLIFIGSEVRTYRLLKWVNREQLQFSHFDPNGEGLAASRARLIQKLTAKKIKLSSQMITDILDAKENIRIGKSNGGLVILLGLFGTFFGLMLSISTAGGIIENQSDPGNILNTVQEIFSSMKGIFGTSLCGLLASLVLNASHSILVSRYDTFMAELDEFTLLELLPSSSENAVSGEDRLISVVETLTAQMETMQQQNSAAGIASAVGELKTGISNSVTELKSGISSSVAGLKTEMSSELAALFEKYAAGLQTSESALAGSLKEMQASSIAELKNAITAFGENFANVFNRQIDVVLEQWKKAEEGQLAGLEVLKTSSEKMTESALRQSAAFSESSAGKMNQFFETVHESFGKFSESSKALVDAQKTLIEEVEKRIQKENESSLELSSNISEAATLMRVNQSEFSATLEMFRQGMELVLEKLSGNTEEQQNEQNFVEQLQLSLESFQERAGEILVENALKTQEILLEILEQSGRAPAGEVKSDA